MSLVDGQSLAMRAKSEIGGAAGDVHYPDRVVLALQLTSLLHLRLLST